VVFREDDRTTDVLLVEAVVTAENLLPYCANGVVVPICVADKLPLAGCAVGAVADGTDAELAETLLFLAVPSKDCEL
jgi:hypothetical protein